MALSDACFEFIEAVEAAARKLSEDAHHYGAPDYPIRYGLEVEALKRAARDVVERPFEGSGVGALVSLVAKVGAYLDASPDDPSLDTKKASVDRLVRLLMAAEVGDLGSVEGVVGTAISGKGQYAARAAAELKKMLSKLSKPAYEAAVKIVSDVASATVKKMLGL